MKKNILYTIILVLLLSACGNNVDEKRFYDVYTQILEIREANPDTTIANPLVNKIFEQNQYPKEQFKVEYFELAQDGDKFIRKVDSIKLLVSRK
jgi:hypothetical protein